MNIKQSGMNVFLWILCVAQVFVLSPPAGAALPGRMEMTQKVAAAVDTTSQADSPREEPPVAEENSQQEIAGKTLDLLQLKDMDIKEVLELISEKSGLSIIAGQNISGRVTIFLKNVRVEDALRIILDTNHLAYVMEDGIVRVMSAQEFQTRYGMKFGSNLTTQTVKLKYTSCADVSSLLNQMKSSEGKIISDELSRTLVLADAPEQIAKMRQLIADVDRPLETRVFFIHYAGVKELAAKVSEVLSKAGGQLKFDERTSRLVVTDHPFKIKQAEEIIKAFDVQEREVLIEAKIIQVVLSDELKFGIDWEALVKDYHDLDLVSSFDILHSGEKRGTMSIGALSRDDYTAVLQALQTIGTTNILSNPRITAVNNREAKILVGATEPYVTTTTTIPSSGPATTAESVNFIEVGVKLYVTPTIHDDDFITMKIRPEVSSVTKTLTTANNNTIPVVETSEAETTVRVKDGVTVIIGGLIKEETIRTKNKVPLLGDLPLLGLAFRNEDNLRRKTEIVIFLTPRIITGDIPAEIPAEKIRRFFKFAVEWCLMISG